MKHPPIVFLALTVTLLSAPGCACTSTPSSSAHQSSPASFDLAGMRKVIEGKNSQFTKAHVTGDNATIDNMFTRDAKVLAPNADPVIGRAAIAKLTSEYIAFGISEFREETTDFYGNEELLIDHGSYVMVYGPDKVREQGKYVNVWRKEDGDWKIYSNIWNTNAPPAPAK